MKPPSAADVIAVNVCRPAGAFRRPVSPTCARTGPLF